MPTFAEHPFSMEKVPVPPGVDPTLAAMMKLMYDDIVGRAETMASILQMDEHLLTGAAAEMTVDDIESFQLGALCAAISFSELLASREMVDSKKMAYYLAELAHKK